MIFLPSNKQQGLSFLGQAKIYLLAKETDEVREDSASQNQSADAGILAHDKNDGFLLGEQSRCHLCYWTTNYSTDLKIIH